MKSSSHSIICLHSCLNIFYAEFLVLVSGTLDDFLEGTCILQSNIFFRNKIIVVPL